MAKCPSCGFGYCYIPFEVSGFECVNSSCRYFVAKHYLAMKDEIEKKPEEPQMSFNYGEDDGDSSPINFAGFVSNWSSTYSASLAADPNQTYLPYAQAVSASLARKKP